MHSIYYFLRVRHPLYSPGTQLSTTSAVAAWAAYIALKEGFPNARLEISQFDHSSTPPSLKLSEDDLVRAALSEPSTRHQDLGTVEKPK